MFFFQFSWGFGLITNSHFQKDEIAVYIRLN